MDKVDVLKGKKTHILVILFVAFSLFNGQDPTATLGIDPDALEQSLGALMVSTVKMGLDRAGATEAPAEKPVE